AGNGNVVARAYGVGIAGGNPDANVVTDKSKEERLENVPIVGDFSEVFPKDLPGLPLTQQVEFQIDLIPGAAPVARAPYRLAPKEPLSASENRQFIRSASRVEYLLEDRPKVSGDKQEAAFQLLKQKLYSALILALPEGAEDYVAYWDASHKGLGAVLMQREKVISYASRKLKIHEKNYTTHDLDLGKANVVTDALSRKERIKPLRRAFQKALGTRLDMSIAYHPETDGQTERTIHTLEDMLCACVIDFVKGWERHLPLVKFSYNNSYHASIKVAPFEALYGRKCRSPLCWAESSPVRRALSSKLKTFVVDEDARVVKRWGIRLCLNRLISRSIISTGSSTKQSLSSICNSSTELPMARRIDTSSNC
nr:putative reverse transcriptase domain-containing protein [Tanacetum cinerariifolium]